MYSTTLAAPRSLLRDASLTAVAAGFVTVLVGFASSAAIVFQAAQSLGATSGQTRSEQIIRSHSSPGTTGWHGSSCR